MASLSYSQVGSLNPTLNDSGRVVTDFSEDYDWAYGVAIQPDDGKIIVPGQTRYYSNTGSAYFSVARYNSDGSLDQSFGTSGLVNNHFNTTGAYGSKLAVVAGYVTNAAGDVSSFDFCVARYDLGDITSVQTNKNDLPKSFSLEQNYPNPFNPSTTIEFSIPRQSFVTLKVYDLLGRDVTTLVNEELQVGSYKTQFNASKLASGVYLYRLNVNGITQTRKLTVMK